MQTSGLDPRSAQLAGDPCVVRASSPDSVRPKWPDNSFVGRCRRRDDRPTPVGRPKVGRASARQNGARKWVGLQPDEPPSPQQAVGRASARRAAGPAASCGSGFSPTSHRARSKDSSDSSPTHTGRASARVGRALARQATEPAAGRSRTEVRPTRVPPPRMWVGLQPDKPPNRQQGLVGLKSDPQGSVPQVGRASARQATEPAAGLRRTQVRPTRLDDRKDHPASTVP